MSFTPDGSQALEIEITASDEGATGAFGDVETSAIDMRKAVAGAGGVLAGAGAAGLASSASAAADFEQAMADVEKVTDPETADELSGSIQDLAGEIPLAQEELAGLATQAGRMGADGADEIEEFTRVAAEMGAATTLSSDEAGTALGKMSSALGEPLDNAGNLGDAINEVSNNFQATSDEIVDSAQRSGQAMSTLGMESDEIIGLAGAFNEVSPTSRVAATRMEQVSEAMMDPGNVEMFADILGVTADEFKSMREEAPQETMMELMDSVSGNQDALDTLNDGLSGAQARAFRDTADSADEMQAAVETSNQAMEENGSLAEEVATETDTFHGQMALLSNEIENLKIQIGENLLPVLIDMFEAVSPAIDAFLEFNESLDGMPALIGLVGTTLAGLGAIAVAVGPAIVGALSPILAPVAAIAAAVGALYYIWTNDFAGIQGIVEDVWDTLQSVFNSIRDIINEVFEEHAKPAIQSLKTLWEEEFQEISEAVEETMDVVMGRVEPVLNYIVGFWQDHGDQVMTIVDTLFSAMEVTIGAVMRAISTQIQIVLALIRGDFGEVLTLIKDFWTETFDDVLGYFTGDFVSGLRAALDIVVSAIKRPFEAIYDFLIGNSIIPETFNGILEFIQDVFVEGLVETFEEIFEFYVEIWTDIFEFYVETWEDIFDTVDDFAADIYDRVDEFLDDTLGVVEGVLTDVLDFYIETWSDIFDTVDDFAADIYDRVDEFLDDTLSVVEDVLTDVLDFYVETWSDIFDTVDDFAADIYDRVETFLDDLYAEWTSMFTDVYDFLVDTWNDIESATEDAVTWLLNRVETFLSDLYSEWTSMFSDVYDYLVDTWNDIESATEDAVTWLLNRVETFLSDLFTEWQRVLSNVYSYLSETWDDIRSDTNEALNQLLNRITTFLSDLFDSWSETFSDIYENVVDTFGDIQSWLLETGRAWISSAFDTIFNDVLGALTDFLNKISGDIQASIGSITDWLGETGVQYFRTAFGAIEDTITGIIDSAIDYIEDAITGLTSWITDTVGGAVDDAVDMFNDAVPSQIEIPEISIGGQSLDIPSMSINNPLGNDWRIGGGSLDVPSRSVGGQSLDLPQLAEGGIVDQTTIAMIGEAGQEAVVPLNKLNSYLDTAYEAGRKTATQVTHQATGGSRAETIAVKLEIDGEDELAELIRENAEVVVDENENSKSNRIARM